MNRKLILAGAAAFALAALALAAAYFYVPGGARPSFDEGDVRICLNGDGTMDLFWPEARLGGTPAEESAREDETAPPDAPASGDVSYLLEVRNDEQSRPALTSSQPMLLHCTALELPLELRIQAVTEGKNLLGLSRTLTSPVLTVEVDGTELSAPEAIGLPGPGTLSLSWEQTGPVPELYEIFTLEDGGYRRVVSTSEKQVDLTVRKQGGDLLLPGYGPLLEVHVRAGVRGAGYVLCGPASNAILVERQDLLGDDLNLAYREAEPRVFTLEWDETRGEYYEVQEWSEEGWTLLDTLEPAESFTYELGRLGSGSRHRFQVVAKDRNGTLRSSEEAEFFASVDPLYATIWPIIDQPFFEEADGESATLGKIPGGTALCVLMEEGDWFRVRYKDQYGWVDSRFCMINLPEYVGDHCSYDITNSYRSVFKVHENPIALITDQVVQGFEHIQEAGGQFLVPYLYPCSKKLLSAAQAAEADGYRLKIYEAFRPNEATRFLYDTTAAQLDWAALVYSYEDAEGEPLGVDEDPRILDPVTGWVVDLADGLLTDPETGEKISREDLALRQEEAENPEGQEAPYDEPGPGGQLMTPAESQDSPAAETPDLPFFTLPEEGEGGSLDPADPPPEPQPAPLPEEAPEGEEDGGETPEYETYFQIMTNNGRFNLGSFLAKVASAHNRGIALDLTLEKLDGGEELEMQSAIHDLSWYSAAYLNNDNAKRLEKYMTGAGMRGLSSEWWHFQDDETREAIGLTSYLFKGVDMSGWVWDGWGWRYRDADGSIYKNASFTVDGERYASDSNGYILQE
nr:M15 family metallopeptidase [uncultured Oscillibacter sp.]